MNKARLGALAATALVATILPATSSSAVVKNFTEYRYTDCGVFKTNTKGYVFENGTIDINSSRTKVNDWTLQVNSYECGGTRGEPISRIAGKHHYVMYGRNLSCSAGSSGIDCSMTYPTSSWGNGFQGRDNASSYTRTVDGITQHGNVDQGYLRVTGRFKAQNDRDVTVEQPFDDD